MLEAKQGKEIVLSVKNKVGLLFELSKLISEKGISVLAIAGMVLGDEGVIRMVTDDNLRTMDMLTEKGYKPVEQEVILVEAPHKPGMLRTVSELLANENVGIQHLYASAGITQDSCLMVLHSTNDEHILPRLHKLQVIQV